LPMAIAPARKITMDKTAAKTGRSTKNFEKFNLVSSFG
jgi:hypothetical protein